MISDKALFDSYTPQRAELLSRYFDLTRRQRLIFRLIAQGHNRKEIAFKLKRSLKTIEYHISKFPEDLRNPVRATHFALAIGLTKNLYMT